MDSTHSKGILISGSFLIKLKRTVKADAAEQTFSHFSSVSIVFFEVTPVSHE